MPLTKYRWKKGYTHRIGSVTTIATVIRTDSAVCFVATLARALESWVLRTSEARDDASF